MKVLLIVSLVSLGVIFLSKKLKISTLVYWASCRRKPSVNVNDGIEVPLEGINKLYHVEYLAIERNELGSANHLKLRQMRSKEILAKMKKQLEIDIGKATPKSPFGKALKYLSNNWESLTRFLSDARIRLDNNISERALRIVGRKNYLFVGTKEAGENLAILQSLVQTCKLHQVNPQKYLADVLIRMQTHPQADIAQLHPKNWKSL